MDSSCSPKISHSPYQLAIFDHIKTGKGNLMIEAVAGSGKTTTIVSALKLIPPMDKVLFLAFNKKIAEDIQARVPSGVQACTFHSLGFQAIRDRRKVKVKNNYMWEIVQNEAPDEYRKIFHVIDRIISLAKATNAPMSDIIDFYGIDIPNVRGFGDILGRCWLKAIETKDYINFDDMLWVPTMGEYEFPKFDWVFVDEAQDLSPIQVDMLFQLKNERTRFVLVGDRAQAIYGFRGAQTDAIPSIIEALHCTTLPLSISYRCPFNIVEKARALVPTIEAHNPGGKVYTEQYPEYQDGDLILCRCTAPLVKECLNLIRQGKKAHVVGQDQDLLKTWKEVKKIGLDAFKNKVYDKYKGSRLSDYLDQIDTLEALQEFNPDIEAAIAQVFGNDMRGITFMTIHRSKGLERDRVFILNPELLPHPKAENAWEREQEKNLEYVAITRAKQELCYVTNPKVQAS